MRMLVGKVNVTAGLLRAGVASGSLPVVRILARAFKGDWTGVIRVVSGMGETALAQALLTVGQALFEDGTTLPIIAPEWSSNIAGMLGAVSVEVDIPDWRQQFLSPAVFTGCLGLKSVALSGVATIGDWAFSECVSLESLDLPGVSTIGLNAFHHCRGLNNVHLHDTLTWIRANAFSGCEALTGIALPPSLKMIGDYAFSGCTSLRDIVIRPWELVECGLCVFGGSDRFRFDLRVPDGDPPWTRRPFDIVVRLADSANQTLGLAPAEFVASFLHSFDGNKPEVQWAAMARLVVHADKRGDAPVMQALDAAYRGPRLLCPLAWITKDELANLIINDRGGLALLNACACFSSCPSDIPGARAEGGVVEGSFFERLVAFGALQEALQLFDNSPGKIALFKTLPSYAESDQPGPFEVPMVEIFAHFGQTLMIRGAHARHCDFSERAVTIAMNAGHTELAHEMRMMIEDRTRRRASREDEASSALREAKREVFMELAKNGDQREAFGVALVPLKDHIISDVATAAGTLANKKPNRMREFLRHFPLAFEVVIRAAADSRGHARGDPGPIAAFLSDEFLADKSLSPEYGDWLKVHAGEILRRLLHARNMAGALALIAAYPEVVPAEESVILTSAVFAWDAADLCVQLCPGVDLWTYVKVFGSVRISRLHPLDARIAGDDVDEIVSRGHYKLLMALKLDGRLNAFDLVQKCIDIDAVDCARALVYMNVTVTEAHRAVGSLSAAMKAVLALAVVIAKGRGPRKHVHDRLEIAFNKSHVSSFGLKSCMRRLRYDQTSAATRDFLNKCESWENRRWTLADESWRETENGIAAIVVTFDHTGVCEIYIIQNEEKAICLLQANIAALLKAGGRMGVNEGATFIRDHSSAVSMRELCEVGFSVGVDARFSTPNADASRMFPAESIQNGFWAGVLDWSTREAVFIQLKAFEFEVNHSRLNIGQTLAGAWLPGLVTEMMVCGDSIAQPRQNREGMNFELIEPELRPDARSFNLERCFHFFALVSAGVGWDEIRRTVGAGRGMTQVASENFRAGIPFHVPVFGPVTVRAIAATPDGHFAAFVFSDGNAFTMRTDELWQFRTILLAALKHLRENKFRPHFRGFVANFFVFEYWSGPRFRLPAAELPGFNTLVLAEEHDHEHAFDTSLHGGDFIVTVDELQLEMQPGPSFASVPGFFAREVNMHVRFDPHSLTAVLRFGEEPTMRTDRRVFLGHWLEVAGALGAMNRIAALDNAELTTQFRADLLWIKQNLDHSRVAQAIAAHSRAEFLLGNSAPIVAGIAELTGYDAAIVCRTFAELRERGCDFCGLDLPVPAWLSQRRAFTEEITAAGGNLALWNGRIEILDAKISALESGVDNALDAVDGLAVGVDVRDALTIVGQAGLLEMLKNRSENIIVNFRTTFERLRAAGFHVAEHVMRTLIYRLQELEVFD